MGFGLATWKTVLMSTLACRFQMFLQQLRHAYLQMSNSWYRQRTVNIPPSCNCFHHSNSSSLTTRRSMRWIPCGSLKGLKRCGLNFLQWPALRAKLLSSQEQRATSSLTLNLVRKLRPQLYQRHNHCTLTPCSLSKVLSQSASHPLTCSSMIPVISFIDQSLTIL